jgi:uncharacterized protein YbjT (DUF2867 family)
VSRPARSILVCGASGFIGRRIVRTLREAGLSVTEASSASHNFSQNLQPSDWLPRLEGFDAVVNAVGILRDTRDRKLDALHHRAPAALFEACAQVGVRRVIQISANGVDQFNTRYATTKRAADEVLLRLRAEGRLDGSVVRPSIVYGRGGASSALFMTLARLPVMVLPAAALRARIQPVAVQDVALAVLRLLQEGGPEQVTAVGVQALPLSAFIAELRRQLGHGQALVVPLPEAPSRWSARVGDHLSFQPWSTESLAMLQSDNVGDAAVFAHLLGRSPLPLERFVEAAWQSA